MYFLIGIWGGPRRVYAAIKFFIYTLVGSVLMLLAMLALYFNTDPYTFNMLTLMQLAPGFSASFQWWIFLALFIGFAIKVPVFPFHTWLPDAHVEAPTAASVILAGVLLKMGGYGFFRILYPMAPDAGVSHFFIMMVALLGLINIVYGALCAMAQKDFKSLVAYSSISHMGYVLLGMAAFTPGGANGAVLQMFNHGVSSAMMFLLVGVVYDRAHHRDLNRFGGLGLQMPYYTGLATIGFFASLGLPGLNGFISEALVFLGAFSTTMFPKWIVFVSASGIVLTAGYILWTIQRVYFGPLNEKYAKFKDVSAREVAVLAPLAVLCILFGVWPKLILDTLGGSINTFLDLMQNSISMAMGG
jgi:NADH-quinone oxidoreductase subunit M